jgi:hypothetical protein
LRNNSSKQYHNKKNLFKLEMVELVKIKQMVELVKMEEMVLQFIVVVGLEEM